jgi:hypothetical protein
VIRANAYNGLVTAAKSLARVGMKKTLARVEVFLYENNTYYR